MSLGMKQAQSGKLIDNSVFTNNKKIASVAYNLLKQNGEYFIACDNGIQEQLDERIVDKFPDEAPLKGKEFYLPHKAVPEEDYLCWIKSCGIYFCRTNFCEFGLYSQK